MKFVALNVMFTMFAGSALAERSVFNVSAANSAGKYFSNESPERKSFLFTASGSWSINKKFHGPEGRLSNPWCRPPCILDGAPVGALVMKRQNGQGVMVGNRLSITLNPWEEVRFYANDGYAYFSDDRGFVTVVADC